MAQEFFKVSDLLKSGRRQEFSRVLSECYCMTDWITEDYPDHCWHFYHKYVPGLFNGSREIIACRVDGRIVAVAFLKKTLGPTELGPNGHSDIERKLSTLYVDPQYRKSNLTHELLQHCFAWLETTKPLATITEYKLSQFADIIQRYGWVGTQVLEVGYYNENFKEYVFNGYI